MNAAELRELIKQELPRLVREDPEIQDLILRLSRQEQQTEDRFDRLFAKLERDAEASNRRWEEHREETNRQFKEHREEFSRVHEEIMAMN